MSTPPMTMIFIHHHPRGNVVEVCAPGGKTELRIEAPPRVALRALADYLTQWAAGKRGPHA